MLPQEKSLDILCEFLSHYGYTQVESIPIGTIRKLAHIVLTENAFVYDGKFYKQILGGAMGSPFTLTLANIFMWKWEKEFIRRQNEPNEIYSRYIDDVIFTSNQSLEAIQQLLNEANQFHTNIKLTGTVGKSVSFLDVHITIRDGQFSTAAYTKDSAEPYIIPFKSDHPRHTFGSIVQAAMARALRYSSTPNLFNAEFRNLRLTLLYNGYPSAFINTYYRKFLIKQQLKPIRILPLIPNGENYDEARRVILRLPPASQSQHSRNIQNILISSNDSTATALADMNHQQSIRPGNPSKPYQPKLILHYHHERRLFRYKKDIHQLWAKSFSRTPLPATKLTLGHRNHSNLKRELVRKKPRILLRQKD